jgi:hypothetical protein
MKIKSMIKTMLTVLVLFFSLQLLASVQLEESFTTPNFPTSSFHNGTYSLSSGTWDAKNVMGLETNNAYNETGEAVKLNRYLEAYLTTPSVNSVGSISFYYRNFTDLLGGGSFVLQKSIDNGPFVDLITVDFSSTDSYELLTVEINDPSDNIKFRIYIPEETNTGYLCVDEIVITDIGQTLAASPSGLNDFHYYYGFGPSESKSFTLLGANLTGFPDDITITAPENYEVSLDNTAFSNSLILPYISATLAPTYIYVRLIEGLEIDNYNNADILISGGGAPSFVVTCSGNITEKPLPVISANPSSLTGYTYVFGAGPSDYQSVSLSVTNLNEYPDVISIVAPNGFHISTDFVTYTDSLTIPYSAEIMTTTTVYARMKPGLPVNTYSGEIQIDAEGTNGFVSCSGTVTEPSNPVLSSTESVMSGFSYILGSGPSDPQSFEISGSNLSEISGNVAVTAPTNYEVSLDNSTYENTLTIPYSESTLESTLIYVRLIAGLDMGSYNNETIEITGGGASPYNVSCYGNVISPPSPILSVNETELSGFEYAVGAGPSIPQSFNLSAVNLTDYPDDITVTAPLNYEVSYDYPNFAETVYVPYSSETLDWTPIYVRLKAGLFEGEYNDENIVISVLGASNVNVSCNGTVEVPLTPYLSVSPTSLSGFSYILGNGPSSEQSYTLSGANLTSSPGNITVIAPTNYEISLSSGTGFSNSLLVPFTDANFSDEIYVRLKSGLSEGDYNGESITHNGGGASEVILSCSGTVDPIPPASFTVSSNSLSNFTYVVGNGPSAEQSFNLSGTYLTGYPDNITIEAPENYEISLSSGSDFSTQIILPYTSETLSITTIYVRLESGLPIGDYSSGSIGITGGGADAESVLCNGNVTDLPPPVLSLTPTSLSGFSYILGNGPSAEQSYTLSGANLTGYPGNITVIAPTNYEISLSSGTGFSSSLLVPFADANVSEEIYVRLKSGLTEGDYNSESITHLGGGAWEVILSCNGTVLPETTDPCLFEDFSGFTTGTHESPNSTDVSSSLDSYTLVSGWEGLKIFSANGEIKLGSSSTNGYIITPTIDLSAGGTLEFDHAKWSSDDPTVQVYHASDGINFVQVGSDISTTTDFQNHSIEITGGTASSKIKIAGTERIYLDNIELYCGIQTPDPVLYVSPNELTSFSYLFEEGPSLSQSFELSGSDLDDSQLEIIPPENYEISLSESSGYSSNPIILNAFDGNSMSIYVRLKADLPVGDYNNETIDISGSGTTSVSVTCSGYVDDNVEIGQFTDESIQIYPNPANHSLFVDAGQHFEHFTWIICDITGRVFDSGQESVLDKTIQIDISDLQSGLYVLILTDGNHQLTRKIEKL